MVLTVKTGDVYGLTYVASVANNWSATLKVRNRHGVVRKYAYREDAATATRAATSFTTQRIEEDGEIVGFAAAVGSVAATKRGQFYMNAFVLGESSSGDLEVSLAKGYIYDGKSLALGDSVEPGPGGGEGFLSWVALADDVAPVDVTQVLAAANTLRKVYGLNWVYDCAAVVATRTLNVSLRKVGLARPTGFAGTGIVWNLVGISLTTGEEGVLYVFERYSAQNDNGTVVVESTASKPTVFPLWIEENDLAELFFDVAAADADDRHSIYLLQE